MYYDYLTTAVRKYRSFPDGLANGKFDPLRPVKTQAGMAALSYEAATPCAGANPLIVNPF